MTGVAFLLAVTRVPYASTRKEDEQVFASHLADIWTAASGVERNPGLRLSSL